MSPLSHSFHLARLARALVTCLLLPLLLVLKPAALRAQAEARPDLAAELQRDWLDQRRRALQAAVPVLGARVAPVPPAPVVGETPCFAIHQVWLDADGQPAPTQLAHSLGAFEGACLGPQSIENLRAHLQQRLAEAGWITSTISVPAQRIADGQLRLQVHWGRVDAVQIGDGVGPALAAGSAARPAANALSVRPGDPLNLRDLEQTLETLARLPSQASRFHIAPGRVPGTSLVVISPEGGPRWRGSMGIESTDNREYGAWLSQASATMDAPLGWSDQLALVASWAGRDLGGQAPQQHSWLAQYSVPWGGQLWSLNLSQSRFRRSIQGGVGRFNETGSDTLLQTRWQATAWRGASARLTWWLGVSTQRSRAFIDGTELLLRRRDSSRAEFGAAWFSRLGCGDLSMDLEGSYTLHMAHDTVFQEPRQSRPTSWRMQLAWQCALADAGQAGPWHWTVRAWAQGTRHPGSSADLALVGSQWTVRGHPAEAALSGQGATVVRQELQSPAQPFGDHGAWRALVALDHGRIHQPVAADGRRQLSGAGLGLRWQWAAWSGSVMAAHAIGPRSQRPTPSAGLLLHGSAAFNF